MRWIKKEKERHHKRSQLYTHKGRGGGGVGVGGRQQMLWLFLWCTWWPNIVGHWHEKTKGTTTGAWFVRFLSMLMKLCMPGRVGQRVSMRKRELRSLTVPRQLKIFTAVVFEIWICFTFFPKLFSALSLPLHCYTLIHIIWRHHFILRTRKETMEVQYTLQVL